MLVILPVNGRVTIRLDVLVRVAVGASMPASSLAVVVPVAVAVAASSPASRTVPVAVLVVVAIPASCTVVVPVPVEVGPPASWSDGWQVPPIHSMLVLRQAVLAVQHG